MSCWAIPGSIIDDYRGIKRVWHSGGAAGYNAWMGRFPDHGLSIALLCNLEEVSATANAHRVADLFLPATAQTVSANVPAINADSIGLNSKAGLFLNERTGEPLQLIVNDGQLRIPGARAALTRVTKDRFHVPGGDLFFRSQDEFELHFLSKDEFEITSMEGKAERYRRARAYTPTAADLQAYAGRYKSDDLGGEYEIKTGPESVVVHRVDSGGQGTEMKAISRDMFLRGLTKVQFRRDEAGNVVAFELSNPVLRNLRITRLSNPTGRQ